MRDRGHKREKGEVASKWGGRRHRSVHPQFVVYPAPLPRHAVVAVMRGGEVVARMATLAAAELEICG